MKTLRTLFVSLTLLTSYSSFSQIKIDVKEVLNDSIDHYVTHNISYPITGIYQFEGNTEPNLELRGNGSGMIQFEEDLSKKEIIWGIECSQTGNPIRKKGYDSASYTLWYQFKDKQEGEETNNWIPAHFSIHFKQLKMYALGDRSKTYIDPTDNPNATK